MSSTSNYRPIQTASLQFDDDGTPFSFSYGDVYHPQAGAMGQARHVFMAGCGLPNAWQGHDQYVIIETGFGLGHNFLAVWDAWRNDPRHGKQLHFISVEKHPFEARDLREAHKLSGAPADLSARLCEQWPLPLPGFHRLHFDEAQITLTLLFGEAHMLLPELHAQADAIFLDGFAPGKNPDMWSPAVFRALAELSHADTRIATWSVSGWVRTGLAEAGFLTDKAPGFAGKREMLCGHAITASTRRASPLDRRALVIGAGIAGTGIAERLAARGWQVELIESTSQPAQGASGNIAGVFRPLPSATDGRLFRLTRSGFLYALRHLRRLQAEELGIRWDSCSAMHLARDAEQESKLREIAATIQAPVDFARFVDRDTAARIAGRPVKFGGWFFAQAGWINPPSLCVANLARYPDRIRCTFGQKVHRLQKVAGLWRAMSVTGQVLGEAPVVVLANASDARRLALSDWLPIHGARGQISYLPADSVPVLHSVVCSQGYVIPAVDGWVSAGSSFFVDDDNTHIRLGEHLENLDKLEQMLPGFSGSLSPSKLSGRVSIRPISPDRMPIVGELPSVSRGNGFDIETVPRHAGLYLLTALGSQGLTWSSVLAEHLASKIEGDPRPISETLSDRVDPARFLFHRHRTDKAAG